MQINYNANAESHVKLVPKTYITMSGWNASQGNNPLVLMRHHVDLSKPLYFGFAAAIILTSNGAKTKRRVKLPLCENGSDIPVVKETSQEETVRFVGIIDPSPWQPLLCTQL